MKAKLFILVLLAAIMTSCWLEKSKYPVVGRWQYTDYEQSVYYTAEFKNYHEFSLKEKYPPIEEENSIKHHTEKFYGTYTVSENILTLHFTEIQYRNTEYRDHVLVLDTTINIPPFADETVQYETDENRNQLTLIRHFGTDSVTTQVYQRQKYK